MRKFLIILLIFSMKFCFTQINRTISIIDDLSIVAKIDISQLEKSKFIFTDFDGQDYIVIKKELKKNGDNIEYVGSIEGVASNFIFVKKGVKCYGKLQTINGIYEFRSIDSEVFTINRHSVFLPSKTCGLEFENYSPNINEQINVPIAINNEKIGRGTTLPSECNLRLLIALTEQVSLDPLSDVSMIVAVIELNQVLINSGIMHKVDLVGIIHNVSNNGFENESNSSIAIENLMNENDGIADFLVNEKKKYSADILALIQNTPFSNSMGVAGGIGTDFDHSYCIGVRDAVVFYYTLTHEIGHLLGASHHNISPTSLTYGNARGYYRKITSEDNNSNDYYIGTIMTTGLLNQTNFSTTRQPYFSNLVNIDPTYGLLGSSNRNSAATLNYTLANHVKGLRNIPQNIVVENSAGYSSFYAKNSITTGTVYNSNSGFLVAENSISLKPGTHLSQNFSVQISEISSCGTGEVPGAIYFSKTDDYLIKDRVMIYPNPSFNYIMFQSQGFKVEKITIYDINSSVVFCSTSIDNNRVSTKELKKGTYFIKLENKEYSQTIKFNKK